jgi:hypothetical protein
VPVLRSLLAKRDEQMELRMKKTVTKRCTKSRTPGQPARFNASTLSPRRSETKTGQRFNATKRFYNFSPPLRAIFDLSHLVIQKVAAKNGACCSTSTTYNAFTAIESSKNSRLMGRQLTLAISLQSQDSRRRVRSVSVGKNTGKINPRKSTESEDGYIDTKSSFQIVKIFMLIFPNHQTCESASHHNDWNHNGFCEKPVSRPIEEMSEGLRLDGRTVGRDIMLTN